ncbi:MAG TPA: hypothetical protein VKT54_06740 [Steroidobacteraceae bacterium]|nr:hypothetical protein [Steroidobacteraceae bacterium]
MRTLFLTMLLVVSASAASQQPPAAAPRAPASAVAPPPEQLEPAVDTTATSSPPAEASQRQPSASREPARAGAVSAPAPPPKARAKGPDRVELETTDITGNRELPKVLYIVPWRRSDLGDLVGKPPNSLLDDVLQPIDREVFLRENRYYDAVKPDAATGRPGAVPGSGDKP